jgi:N-acetylmuramoyl-L-alanine amidase
MSCWATTWFHEKLRGKGIRSLLHPIDSGSLGVLGGSAIGPWLRWQLIFLLFVAPWLAPAAFASSIAVDVGHYLANPGVISARGIPEFDYNLRLAREVSEALGRAGHKTLLIGDDGLAENLGARAPRAKGMDLFISIHHDSVQPRFLSAWESAGETYWYSDRFSGFSLFVSRLNSHTEASLKCASAIGAALRGAGFRPSRYHADPVVGENRPFADEANGVHYFDNLAVLKTASTPALLFEAGVIVNRDEELRMRNPAVRNRIVEAIVSAIGICLG